MTTNGAPPLAARGLTRRFGTLTAVAGLDIEVRPGEILGFLGPNGAGKTTTLRMCAGLLRPDAGEVVVAGAHLEREPRAAKARLGFVPDRPFLYDRLTGAEFLELVGALYDVAPNQVRERAGALATRLEMTDMLGSPIESYSLGMRQKMALMAALLHDPVLLMLDEPLVGLDPLGARTLKDLLRECAARGHGVLVSTHLLEVAERLCDRVLIVSRGRALAAGTLDELRRGRADRTLEDLFLELTRPDGA
jgi:ABC-2 type transport system ATP-binding protein